MSLALEDELREELKLDDPASESNDELSTNVLAILAKTSEAPSVATPCLFAVYSISHNDVARLCEAVGEHFTAFAETPVLPVVFRYLKKRSNPIAIESLAYCKYEHKVLEISNQDVVISNVNDFALHQRLKAHKSTATTSGFLHWPASSDASTQARDLSAASTNIPTWVIKWLVLNENKSKVVIDEWWSFVVSSLLDSLHTADVPRKANAVQLVDILAREHGPLLNKTGLYLIFAETVESCLSFLPPLTRPAETMLIHRPAIECLSKLAQIGDTGCNSRLNFLAREGCLKPFFHTQENVELTIYFLHTLEQFVDIYLQSLTAVHLHGIVKVFNQIMCDPFIDYSPKLVEAACSAMTAAIKWAWPRVGEYQYTIALGLVKANAMETQCFRLLNLPENEIVQLRQYSDERRRSELEA